MKRFSLHYFFNLKQNREVQLDLQHLEILIFLSLLPNLPPGKMKEKKLTSKHDQSFCQCSNPQC